MFPVQLLGATAGNAYRNNDDEYLPLYEAKLVHHFDHRWATYISHSDETCECSLPEKCDPDFWTSPRYWVSLAEVSARVRGRWDRKWFLGFRDICRNTDIRTAISSIVPFAAVGNSLPLILQGKNDPAAIACFAAGFGAFVFDFIARVKICGTHLNFFIAEQLPVLPPDTYSVTCPWSGGTQRLKEWNLPRVLELTYTAWDLEPFAQDCGWSGLPFRWDEDRRFLIRCELDAAFFHLYLRASQDGKWTPARIAAGAVRDEADAELAELKRHFPTPRNAVAHIMDTFPIVRRKDEEKHNGDYRTKRVILEIYDAMAESIRTGHPYQTRLDPPPADPRCCHPPRKT